jgi:hypothetical protein
MPWTAPRKRADDEKPARPFPTRVIVAFLVALNLVAMWGQAGWFHEHITNHDGPEDWLPAVGVALVIEMIGVYLAGMAHAALMADQSAGLLRFGSYLVGLLVGALNFAHFAEGRFGVNASAITFGALSTLSPWLWAIYSRYVNRDRLAALGLVDKRGVKLSTNRKFWHPVKSIQVTSFAAWRGITNPDQAVAEWEAARPGQKPDQGDQVIAADLVFEEWVADPSAPVSPAIGDPWRYALPRADQTSDQETDQVEATDQTGDQVEATDQTSDQETDQVEATDQTGDQDRPTVAELLAQYGDKLRTLRAAGKLTRYQVEQVTGQSRRKAEKVLAALQAERDQTGDKR